MDTNLKVTDQPEEISFEDIVAGDQIINIPLFQRAYRWTEKNIGQFWDDVSNIIDESSRSHFLGVLVLVPQSRRVGQPAILDIVDGQQRLTTCYLAVLAMVEAAIEIDETSWAIEVARSYLLTRSFSNYSTNTKLIPSAADRQQFNDLWTKIVAHRKLESVDWRGDKPSTPQPSGEAKGRMQTAYKSLLRRVRKAASEKGLEGIDELFQIILGRLSFVTINLRSPTAAPAIFERLNARGEKITISDLVRNEIFSRVADRPSQAKSIFENYWEPFIEKFRKHNTDFEPVLFPYGLTLNSNLTKADLFQELRAAWGENEPPDIIREIDQHTPALFALESGVRIYDCQKPFSDAVTSFSKIKAPSSVYPFVFQLTRAVQSETLQSDEATRMLEVVESFLVRRAVCGIEPTGLHAVFKGLWNEIVNGKIDAYAVKQGIARRSTVPWPGDAEFKDAITKSAVYGRRVAGYLLLQFEASRSGESPEDDFQIEHIYPVRPHKDWRIKVDDEVEILRNSWGNLIPLTKSMNPALQNSTYEIKRGHYAESVFATARELSRRYSLWDLEAIKSRNAELAAWAIARWPHVR